jgi:hypothetical protein
MYVRSMRPLVRASLGWKRMALGTTAPIESHMSKTQEHIAQKLDAMTNKQHDFHKYFVSGIIIGLPLAASFFLALASGGESVCLDENDTPMYPGSPWWVPDI